MTHLLREEQTRFRLSAEQINALHEKYNAIPLRAGDPRAAHGPMLMRQALFLTLFESSNNKLIPPTCEALGISNPSLVTGWIKSNEAFVTGLYGLQGKHPNIYWRDIEPYPGIISKLGIEDYPRFPVNARPSLQFNHTQILRVLDAFRSISYQRNPIPKQVLLLLLLQEQPDKNIPAVCEILGLSHDTFYAWRHTSTFMPSLRGLIGGVGGIDWQSVAEYRDAVIEAGLGDLLDPNMQATIHIEKNHRNGKAERVFQDSVAR